MEPEWTLKDHLSQIDPSPMQASNCGFELICVFDWSVYLVCFIFRMETSEPESKNILLNKPLRNTSAFKVEFVDVK